MALNWNGIKNIADITKITIFAYSCYFFFRMGEAFFYGYPFSYISVDSSSLFSVLIKSLMALLAAFIMIKAAMKSDYSAIRNTTIAFFGMIALAINMYQKNNDVYKTLTFIASYLFIFFSLFSIADSMRLFNNSDDEAIQRRAIFKAVFYSWVICFALGNYYYGFAPNGLYQDKDGRVIIAQYNDKYIMKQCKSNGIMATYIADIPDGMLTPVPEHYFVRDVLKAKCNIQITTNDIKVD